MAIRVSLKSTDIKDEIQKNFLGLKLPLELSEGSEGYFESTLLTLDAAKENIKNLLYTNRGERLMYPKFGSNLRSFLFDQIDEDIEMVIEEDIVSTIEKWLPYVNISDIEVQTGFSNVSLTNTIKIKLMVAIKSNPNMFDSLELTIE